MAQHAQMGEYCPVPTATLRPLWDASGALSHGRTAGSAARAREHRSKALSNQPSSSTATSSLVFTRSGCGR